MKIRSSVCALSLLAACSTTGTGSAARESPAPDDAMGHLSVTIDGVRHEWWAVPEPAPDDPLDNAPGWSEYDGQVFVGVVFHARARGDQPEDAALLLSFGIGDADRVDEVRVEYHPNGLDAEPAYLSLFDYVADVRLDRWSTDADTATFSGSLDGALVRLAEREAEQYAETRHVVLSDGAFEFTLPKREF